MTGMIEIHDVNYNSYVNLVGTAHFTRRSLADAYTAIKSLTPTDVALELDWKRFKFLNSACLACSKRGTCLGICEFIGATDTLGNVDANIWLIDMTEQEMRDRIRSRSSPFERSRVRLSRYYTSDEDPVQLWEMGYKDRVIANSKKRMEALRKVSPSIWRVLIDERNAIMAARLAWITSKNLDQGKREKILAFVGAAHVEGIQTLLETPLSIKASLGRLKLPFTQPTLIRRVAIQPV